MKCSVLGCRNNTKVPCGKSFFRFPKDNEIRQEWLEAIGLRDFKPKSFHVVCQDHFLHWQIKTSGRRNTLKEYPVPSVGIISAVKTNTTKLVCPERKEEHSSSLNNDQSEHYVNEEATTSSTSFEETLDNITEVNLNVCVAPSSPLPHTQRSRRKQAIVLRNVERASTVPIWSSS